MSIDTIFRTFISDDGPSLGEIAQNLAAHDSVAIFCETRRDIQVLDQLQIVATSMPPAARVRPASATVRYYAAHHRYHK